MKITVSIRQNSTNTRRESDDKMNRSAKDTFKLGFQNDNNNNKLLETNEMSNMYDTHLDYDGVH